MFNEKREYIYFFFLKKIKWKVEVFEGWASSLFEFDNFSKDILTNLKYKKKNLKLRIIKLKLKDIHLYALHLLGITVQWK